ncbi:WecB/TagA/CpsF family glycosyltransferase [Bacillus massilinigeriensis]|uniref:WecB/TagA/CpsF family glycosyltransferase n=1 Tax=Bacillus massilionigeriensis TaxID=1805475 RepID=UPI00096B00AD|nr:WecB/TagA/CpsF family glycosyltransferase [Bacillus massilionigeriensis]
MKTVDILGIPFVSTSFDHMASLLSERVERKEKTFVVTANPEIVMFAKEDDTYESYLESADYIVPDGNGILLAGKILHKPVEERITGYDLTVELLSRGNKNGWKVYLLGGQEEVNQKAVANIKLTYPNVQVVGSHNGFFDWADDDIQQQISSTEPDLVFVALGVPKQEKWIAENLNRFSKGIFIGVGGSIDVIAGEVKRAPMFWQRLKLEWLYRLLKQPSRWRRMLALPRFVIKVVNHRFQ